jgi:predicted deacetylase
LIVSFHDLHPGSRAACAALLAHLARAGVDRASLLVVPRWHGGPPFTHDASFTGWLRDLSAAGHEICLHGSTHHSEQVTGGPWSRLIGRSYTQGEGEFFQITHDDAARRLHDGLALLAGEAGLPVFGFTPPAWLLSSAGRTALREAGFHYNTTWGTVELLQTGAILAAPTLVYSCRNAWRRTVSRAWVRFWHRRHRRAPLLRLAVHPGDFTDARLEASLVSHLRAAVGSGRRAITYRDLLTPDARPVPPRTAVAA